MMIAKRAGYWVTDGAQALSTFLAQTSERYRALEDALKPVSRTIIDQGRDWTPWADYWTAQMQNLATLRAATRTCVRLFEKEQSSPESPVALVVPATSIAYRSSLRVLEVAIEEADLLITSYRSVCRSLEEKHLRQRPRVLQALRDVEQGACDAIIVARTNWDQAEMLHLRLTALPETMEVQQ